MGASFGYPTLCCCRKIRVPPEIRVLPSRTLSQTLHLENVVRACRYRVIDKTRRTIDTSLLDASVVYSNPLTPLLRLVLDLSYHRCKKRFFTFFILVTFVLLFWRFLFSKRFLFLKNVGKVQSGKQISKKHFQNSSNEINQWVHK